MLRHPSMVDRGCNPFLIKPGDQNGQEYRLEASTYHCNLSQAKTMNTLTQEQITSIAEAVRETLIGGIDSYVSSALEARGINPADISDQQYTEIVDAVFD